MGCFSGTVVVRGLPLQHNVEIETAYWSILDGEKVAAREKQTLRNLLDVSEDTSLRPLSPISGRRSNCRWGMPQVWCLFRNERGLPAEPAECSHWLLDPQQHIRVCGLAV